MAGETKAPVLVIAYRRPKELQRVFASLSGQNDRRIYVFCDGPQSDHELELQKEIRSATQELSATHEVLARFENRHLGLRLGVLTAIDWFFIDENSGIILEDDVVPTSEFFDFCDRGLQNFALVDEIQQLVGYNPFGNKLKFLRKHIYTSRMDCWGWATWKNRWEEFRRQEHAPDSLVDGQWAPQSMVDELDRGRQYAEGGILDSWAYSWAWHALTRRKLSVVPAVNLIDNIGFGEAATHTKNGHGAPTGRLGMTSRTFPNTLAPSRAYMLAAQLLQSAELRTRRLKRRLLRRAKWASAVLQKISELLNPVSHRKYKC